MLRCTAAMTMRGILQDQSIEGFPLVLGQRAATGCLVSRSVSSIFGVWIFFVQAPGGAFSCRKVRGMKVR